MTAIRPPAAALAAFATLAIMACGGQLAASPAPAATAVPSATPATAASPVATTSVDIANFAFKPAIITVKAGSTVTWTNGDQDAHTVAIAGLPVSSPLQMGDKYSHTFGQAGTFSYACSVHPFMKGMVVVTAA